MSGAYVRAFIPTCETFGWTGGPGFSTRIVTRLNGRERRNADWSQPQYSFSLPFQGLTQEQYAPIATMFLNRLGAWGVFLYRNRLDAEAAQEQFAVAEAGQTTFQLSKLAEVDGVVHRRDVRALYVPDPETGEAIPSDVIIRVNGTPTTAFQLDYDTGEIVFDAPMDGGDVLDATYQFAHWVRFVSDKLPMTIVNRNAGGFFVDGSVDLLEQPPPQPEDFSS